MITDAGNLEHCIGGWEVHTKGGPNQSGFEISVIRSDYKHGHISYGWFDENKLLISHNGGPCPWPVTDFVWHKLMIVAEDTANELNNEIRS